jgi:hypothetical protein
VRTRRFPLAELTFIQPCLWSIDEYPDESLDEKMKQHKKIEIAEFENA